MIKFSKEIIDLAFKKRPNTNHIILLCSSGVDSIAATHFYFEQQFNYPITATLHFNHQQRPQNDLMEDKFSLFTDEHEIPCYAPIKLGSKIRNSSEDSMRKARLNYLNTFYNVLFITAHHLNDATESYMLNVLRGKEGFLPIPFITELENSLIVHPFLFTKKSDFVKYATKKDLLKYVVEDETNYQTKGSRRNFLRKEVLPLLEREKMGLNTIVFKKMKERLLFEILKS